MNRITRLAGVAALGLAVAACGKTGGGGSGNVSAADNMLVPADEGTANAADNGAMADNAMGNAGADNMGAGAMGGGNAQ